VGLEWVKKTDEDCRHVQFALSLPKVQEILSEKGWEIRKKIKEI